MRYYKLRQKSTGKFLSTSWRGEFTDKGRVYNGLKTIEPIL